MAGSDFMELANGSRTDWDALGISEGNGGDVCGDCIGDPALREFIVVNASRISCTYCGQARNGPFAVPVSKVVEHMARIINEEFTHRELAAYDAGGGMFYPYFDTFEDLLQEIRFEPAKPHVSADIASFFDKHKWWWKDTYADRLELAWKRFCEAVTYSRRYTFWSSTGDIFPEDHPLRLPAGEVLPEIAGTIADLRLVCEFPEGTEFWRARAGEDGKVLLVPGDFTSPPREKTKQQRMSPAGVSMFYGADDLETAVREITPNNALCGWRASAVRFTARQPLQLLDLTLDLAQKVQQKSYFARDGRKWRHSIGFLERFARDVSRRFVYDNELLQSYAGKHEPGIDYVPTQVFTEYVRYHMRSPDGKPVDGIRYRSSVHEPGWCVVLFLDQEDCLKSLGRPQGPGSRKEAVLEQIERKFRFEDPSYGTGT
jgi:hypothetical protein